MAFEKIYSMGGMTPTIVVYDETAAFEGPSESPANVAQSRIEGWDERTEPYVRPAVPAFQTVEEADAWMEAKAAEPKPDYIAGTYFVGKEPPEKPVIGAIWYDNWRNVSSVWDGTRWRFF